LTKTNRKPTDLERKPAGLVDLSTSTGQKLTGGGTSRRTKIRAIPAMEGGCRGVGEVGEEEDKTHVIEG
jgi:hypothetical protein